ncbi:MAG: beta strand repeat-containing protein [Acetobacteraceae bacterium]
MILNQPAHPNARVINQGTITIGQAGLAALVAPTVANSGVIAAKLGSVVLAGARTATLDLYGDGLVSIAVAGAVTTVPMGPDGKPVKALVTNGGTIVAQGGMVLLTAKAVDGLIQNLVDAGGTISANGVAGQRAGTVLVQGVGGSISIPGTLIAGGEGSGGTGGAIGLDATGGVTVQKTARIDASGPAGGGVVAVGTTLARAKGGPGTPSGLTAKNVGIAAGATISADATASGNGGRVVVLSAAQTRDDGAITAEGGPAGGNGGFVEVSGHDLALDGAVNTGAPLGATGTILLDPFDLTVIPNGCCDDDIITTTPPDPVNGVAYNSGETEVGVDSTVSSAAVQALVGNVTLQAIDDIYFAGDLALTKPNQSLLVQAGNNIVVYSGATVSATGNVEMDASSDAIPGSTTTGGITINGAVTSGGNISLSSGTGGILFGDFSGNANDGNVSANTSTGALALNTSGPITQDSGIITAGTLTGTAPSASLQDANAVGTLGGFSILAGEFLFFNDASDLVVAGPVDAANGSVAISSNSNLTVAGTVSAAGGFVEFTSGGNLAIAAPVDVAGVGSFVSLTATGDLTLAGEINATGGTVGITAGGSITEQGGAILADTFGGTSGGAALFTGTNTIGTLANVSAEIDPPPSFGAGGDFTLVDSTPLTIAAPVTVPAGQTIALVTDGLIEVSQTIFTEGPSLVVFGALEAPGGEISIEPFTASVPVALVGAGPQPAGTLSLDNALLAGITAGTLALTSFAPEPITISGANQLGGLTDPNTGAASGVDALLVKAGGAFSEAAGASVNVGTLGGTSGGAALLTGVNTIGTLAYPNTSDPPATPAFAAGGDFALVDSVPLTITAPVTVPAGQTIALETDGLIEGSQTIFTEAGSLVVFGALEAPGGEVSIEPFTASVPVALVGGGAGTPGTLSIDQALLEVITAGTLALTSNGAEPITISGANQLGGLTDPNTGAASGVDALLVKAGGAFSEAAGASVNVGTLTGSAASVALNGANVISTLGPFTSSGGFSLADTVGLTVLGNVSDASGVTLEVGSGNLTIGNASTFGQLASAGTVNLQVPNGSITVPNGHVQAGMLTGAASGLANFATAHVTTLGAFSVSGGAGQFALTDNAPLTITGPVSAAYLDIAAPGTLTLAGNIFTTGLPLADQSGADPALPGSVLQVLSGGVFQQLGTSVIAPLGGGGATLRIQLPAEGGAANFTNLLAGGANLVLALGPGVASGTLAAGGLLIIGTGGSANLFGSVAGMPDGAAAKTARILPSVNANYLFNGCVIQTTVCTALFAALLRQVPQGIPNIVASRGGPALLPSVTLPAIVLFVIPAVVGENWTDAGGFPLPNIAKLDF